MISILLSAAGLFASHAAAPVRTVGDARSVVEAIYRALPGDAFDFRKLRYAPPLRRLLEREAASAKGEAGLLDAVPFCDCQDTDQRYSFTTHARKTGADSEEVSVRLINGSASIFRIDMVRLPAGWAVADIHSREHASLVGYLRKRLAVGSTAKTRIGR